MLICDCHSSRIILKPRLEIDHESEFGYSVGLVEIMTNRKIRTRTEMEEETNNLDIELPIQPVSKATNKLHLHFAFKMEVV